MAVALAGPSAQIIKGLNGCCMVQLPAEVLSTDDAEDLDVDDMRCGLVRVVRKAFARRVGGRASDHDLSEARCVNDEHRAMDRGIHRGL